MHAWVSEQKKQLNLQSINTGQGAGILLASSEFFNERKSMKPTDILNSVIKVSQDKAEGSFAKLFILGILAGAFISFGAEGSNMAACNLLASPETYGLGRILAGVIFSAGLIMVVLAGAELFTGNTLILCGVLEKKVRASAMLRNWVIVYAGNLAGALLIAWLMNQTGLFSSGSDMLGAMTVKIGAGKTSLAFGRAFILGMLCNWLVCLAVWISFGADSTIGKIFGIVFPITLFVTSGFEHSIANMYYIPAAIFAKADYAQAALDIGLSSQSLNSLDWYGFFVTNLIPVTLGNIAGGCIFVALLYWICYRKA